MWEHVLYNAHVLAGTLEEKRQHSFDDLEVTMPHRKQQRCVAKPRPDAHVGTPEDQLVHQLHLPRRIRGGAEQGAINRVNVDVQSHNQRQ